MTPPVQRPSTPATYYWLAFVGAYLGIVGGGILVYVGAFHLAALYAVVTVVPVLRLWSHERKTWSSLVERTEKAERERDENNTRVASLERRLMLARRFIPQDQLEAYDKKDDEFCAGREDPYLAKTLADCITDFEKLPVQAGAEVMVLWPLPSLEDPQAFIVEVAIPDSTLEGDFRYDTAELPASALERIPT